jgi:hypothetical protein
MGGPSRHSRRTWSASARIAKASSRRSSGHDPGGTVHLEQAGTGYCPDVMAPRYVRFYTPTHERRRIPHASIRVAHQGLGPAGGFMVAARRISPAYPPTSSIDRMVHHYLLAGDLDKRECKRCQPAPAWMTNSKSSLLTRRHQWRTLGTKFFFWPPSNLAVGFCWDHGKTGLEGSAGPSRADMVRLTMTLFTVLSPAESTVLSTARWANLWIYRDAP